MEQVSCFCVCGAFPWSRPKGICWGRMDLLLFPWAGWELTGCVRSCWPFHRAAFPPEAPGAFCWAVPSSAFGHRAIKDILQLITGCNLIFLLAHCQDLEWFMWLEQKCCEQLIQNFHCSHQSGAAAVIPGALTCLYFIGWKSNPGTAFAFNIQGLGSGPGAGSSLEAVPLWGGLSSIEL